MRRPEPRASAAARAAAQAAAATLLLLSAAGRAQEPPQPQPTIQPQAPVQPSVQPSASTDEPLPLSLTELVQLTLVHNAATQAARLQAEAAGRLLQAESALYEPLASLRWRRELQDRPRTYEERTSGLTNVGKTSALEQIITGATGLRGKLPTGATFEFGHELRRRQSNLLATTGERENRGTLTLSIRQPLLRNAGREATEADLRVSELEQQIERQRFVKQLVDVVGEGAGTYWQLVRARDQLLLRERSLESARQLREDVQRRVDGGFAPRVELLEADIAVGSRETERLRAQQLVQEAEARIRNLLNQGGAPGSGQRYRAVESLPAPAATPEAAAEPVTAESTEVTLQRLLEQWPGYQIARLRAEQEQVRLTHARNQQRPDVAVELGYNQNSLVPSFRYALEHSLRDLHTGWYVSLSMEMPIGNTAPRSRREAQEFKRDAARLLMESEARALGNEWATRSSQRDSGQRELALMRREVAQREAMVQAERLNHEAGRSRLSQLLEAEDRLTEVRSRLIEAEVRAQLSELALQALTGELFARFAIRIQ